MNRKEILDQEFNDCTNVKIEIISNKQDLILTLNDMYGRLCIFHFEEVKEFFINYDEDSVDTTSQITEIKMSQDGKFKHFKIDFTFATTGKILCKNFWYETEY